MLLQMGEGKRGRVRRLCRYQGEGEGVGEAVQANNAYGEGGGGQQATTDNKKSSGAGRVSEVCPPRSSKSPYQKPLLPAIVYVLEDHLQSPMPGEPHILYVHHDERYLLICFSAKEPNFSLSDANYLRQFAMHTLRSHLCSNLDRRGR